MKERNTAKTSYRKHFGYERYSCAYLILSFWTILSLAFAQRRYICSCCQSIKLCCAHFCFYLIVGWPNDDGKFVFLVKRVVNEQKKSSFVFIFSRIEIRRLVKGRSINVSLFEPSCSSIDWEHPLKQQKKSRPSLQLRYYV